jgi:tetratricopeptide (TPR) repeat protein
LPAAPPGTWDELLEAAPDEPSPVPPEHVESISRAAALYGRGDFPGATAALEELLVAAPDFPPALQLLGTTFFRLQRYGDAAVCFERFLVHAPSEVWRTQALGHCYYTLGRYEEALAHYRRVLGARPEDLELGSLAEARRGLGLSLMRLGRTEEALSELRQVVELRPDHADAWSWIGQIAYEAGRLEEAEAALERARELQPLEPRPWFLLSKVYFDRGREEDAESARARWQQLDQLTQEIRSVRAKLRHDPRDYGYALRLVELLRSLGDREGLREALGGLLLARPEHVPEVEVRIAMLQVLRSAGDLDAARIAAQALATACPDEPEAWRELEKFYAETRDFQKQVEAGERYLRLRRD